MADSPAESAARTLVEVVPRLGRLISGALEGDPTLALSLRQYRMLERLTARPHRTAELASSSEVSQPTVSAAVTSLEARRLVERTADPVDRRASLIAITPEGRRTYEAARRRVLERLVVVTKGFTDQDAAYLRRLQPSLVEGMDRVRALVRRQPRPTRDDDEG